MCVGMKSLWSYFHFTQTAPEISMLLRFILLICVFLSLISSYRTEGVVTERPFVVKDHLRSLSSLTDPLLRVPSAGAHQFAHLSSAMATNISATKNDTVPTKAFEINRPSRILPEKQGLRWSTIEICRHSFTNRYDCHLNFVCNDWIGPHSYGSPFVSSYSPKLFDADFQDPAKWVFVEMTVNGSGLGRQFDRLGSVQLDGVEVLRTDNQEPSASGTTWSFTKVGSTKSQPWYLMKMNE